LWREECARVKKRLGEVLCERGYVSASDLDRTLQEQKGKGVHLGELILARGLVRKDDLVAVLSEVAGTLYLDCTALAVEPAVLELIPAALARLHRAIPVERHGANLTVAMAEPQNLKSIEELGFKTGLRIVARLGLQHEIDAAIDRLYGTRAPAAEAADARDDDTGMEFISSSAQQRNIEAMREMQAELQQKSKTTPAVQVVASMIRDAAAKHASDIHIEPQPGETIMRLRIDGILRDYRLIPRALQNAVVSRIKILSDMDIAERRVPQDGRFLVRIAAARIDVRVSTLPTQYGEKVVLRLLEATAPRQEFAGLGFPEGTARELQRVLHLPQGLLLVTGPTSSGKSTTLYSSLNVIRRRSVNIVTVEDPVEYAMQGLNQVQVNTKAGLTFPACLRSILRQDPNVIMIGEIRDAETADIAMKAAQTGHLVLSTLHTNDSASAITRLLDIGVAPYQVASSLTAVIAQRLIRKLCTCHTSAPASQAYRSQMQEAGGDGGELEHIAKGCELCDMTGYRGRIGIYEMLVVDESIRLAIRNGDRSEDIRALGRRNGLRLMREEAVERVAEGLTTLEEVQRVVPFEKISAVTCAGCGRELPEMFVFCPFCGSQRPGLQPMKPLRAREPGHQLVNS
jgi:type IV pilus assembly protein PilB